MLNFNTFLAESLDVEKLKHLEHVEDHIIHGGHEGVEHAGSTLSDVFDFMTGKKSKTKITQKYDGAPSIVFGIDPKNGKFFVASKSAFNKDPKINYTPEDIERNHGHAPGLVEKLKAALQELPKIMPKKGGVFQGDLMYTKDDLKDNGDSYSFTPNAITYTADKKDVHGRKAAAAKIGLVVHTRYVGKGDLQDMKADFDVDQGAFQNDPDVHMINPEVDSASISGIEKKQFQKHLEDATKEYSGQDTEIFNVLDGHDVTFKTYINSTVRDGTTPSVDGYQKFMENRLGKEVEKAKSEKGKAKKQEEMDIALEHIKNHKKQFASIFKMHDSLQKAKDVLTKALASSAQSGLKTTMGGKETKPEGFVAIRNGRPSKLVDRAEFSRTNFLQGSFQKNNEPQPEANDETPNNPVVTSFGRMNPPTSGHGVLVDKVQELAKENKAKSVIGLSRSQDPEKNPLSPEQKLKHVKRMFPDAQVELADESEPTLIGHMKKLQKAGHDHVVMVVGSDRVDDIKKLLDSYNGKDFNFKKIDVVSAGQRDPDAEDEDPSSVSATRQRAHAITNKKKEFQKGLPKGFHPEHADELFNDVRQGMDIQIGPETNARALARYAMRQDPIGVKARREQERRLKQKEIEKASKKKPKKPVTEELTASGGDIRGMGYVTGEVGGALTWAALNQSDADTRDQIMNQTKNEFHDKLHTPSGLGARKDLFIQRLVSSIKDRNNGNI